ncbi:DUF2818 family protein [Undibacterium sp.]|uniref:DUF2818 family protein n=1 Tax=Undibacterium sp. TaxID=1914977 RepID=UPI00374DB7C5
MDSKHAALLCLVLAAIMANLPFAPQRWLALPGAKKLGGAAVIRMIEWGLLYLLWMGVAAVLDSQAGLTPGNGWQIWSISIAFFAVLAFPGITYRYLWHAKRTP